MTQNDGASPEEVFADFLARREAGESVTLEQVSSEYPMLAEALARLGSQQSALDHMFEEFLPAPRKEDSFLYPSPFQGVFERLIASPPLLAVGDDIAGYRLIRHLGGGGQGEVWEALQVALNRHVALKFIRPEHVNEDTVRRFHVEARASGRINHSGIVGVLDSGSHEGRNWIAQELVGGGYTLSDALKRFRSAEQLPRDYHRRAAEVVASIAEAMQVVHQAGIVHLDLKPKNVLISEDDEPKVGDFGLARLLDEDSLSHVGLEGTYHYMSPEQAGLQAKHIDARSDVFSLGTILYELLTLRRPFQGDTNQQVLAHILHQTPKDPRELRPEVPRELALITLGALEKHREDRIQSMADLAADLRHFLNHEPLAWAPPTRWERARNWVLRNPARAVGSVLVVLLLGVALQFARDAGQNEERVLELQVASLFMRAEREIDHGRLGHAQKWIEQAQALNADEPFGHVLMAGGHARYARLAEAREEIDRALAKGLSTEEPVDGSAESHYAHAIYLLVVEKYPGYEEVRHHLERAIALDDDVSSALYPLYQVRKTLGDSEGARQALEEFRNRISTKGPFQDFIQALIAELNGDSTGAIQLLERIADQPEQELHGFRYYLALGRNQLIAGELDAAEESLREQLQQAPDNGAAWGLLAVLHTRRALEFRAAGLPFADELQQAEACTERAGDWSAQTPLATEQRLLVAIKRLQFRSDLGQPIPAPLVQDAMERLSAYRELDLDPDLADRLESDVLLFEALPNLIPERLEQGIEFLERSIATYPDNLVARVKLGQELWNKGEPDACLEHMLHAIETWSEGRWDAKWLLAAHVWSFGAAAMLDRESEAESLMRAALELEASRPWEEADVELFTLAEFLATAARRESLRDCAVADRILTEHQLRTKFGDLAEAQVILARIDAACP